MRKSLMAGLSAMCLVVARASALPLEVDSAQLQDAAVASQQGARMAGDGQSCSARKFEEEAFGSLRKSQDRRADGVDVVRAVKTNIPLKTLFLEKYSRSSERDKRDARQAAFLAIEQRKDQLLSDQARLDKLDDSQALVHLAAHGFKVAVAAVIAGVVAVAAGGGALLYAAIGAGAAGTLCGLGGTAALVRKGMERKSIASEMTSLDFMTAELGTTK